LEECLVKNFYTAQDIEDLAAQGKRELVLDDDAVLTDLGRHMADRLGVSIINRSQSGSTPPPSTPASIPVSGSAPRTPLGLGSKPKGCQHGPLPARQSGESVSVSNNQNPAPANSNAVVDQLVGLVKRLGGKGSAG
jgi:hypothetical protein